MSVFQTFLPRRQFFRQTFSFLAALAGVRARPGNGPTTIVIHKGPLRQETLDYLKRALDVYRSKVK